MSSGETWRRQRRMIETAFSRMRVGRAFRGMDAGVADFERRLDPLAARGEAVSLEAAMSHLTADIICRTIFSTSLESRAAREIFDAFAASRTPCERPDPAALARPALGRRQAAPRGAPGLEADPPSARRLDRRPARDGGAPRADIAGDVIAARDPETGAGFSREELIDQIGVFFLAGHETTAGALAWAFFILSQRPEAVARMRAEDRRALRAGPDRFGGGEETQLRAQTSSARPCGSTRRSPSSRGSRWRPAGSAASRCRAAR